MVFSSIVFVFLFLPVFYTIYFFTPAKLKNVAILLGSILFYAWGAPRFIFVILGTTLIDFFVVRWMDKVGAQSRRKLFLSLSIFINLGLLVYFKYSNFFIENINVLLRGIGIQEVGWTKLLLPIGISFYTFETLTYVVDVYRRVHKPLKNFWDYQLYIILFPKMIAGPIIRFHDLADQIYDHTKFETNENRLRGLIRFFIGLGKKVLIANAMGMAANQIFSLPDNELGTITAWFGALSYTFQIYFDFSGYSDMAIGLALMMGFRFPENFNNPYTAVSVTDFWRRWHISLGNWMREYLYIPLGGNKVSYKWRLYFNLWIVFLASGLWHGAEWGFVIWGVYHGTFLVIERLFLNKVLTRLGKFSCIYTFIVVMVGWVFFKTEHLPKALHFLNRMFLWKIDSSRWYPDREFIFTLGLAAFFSFFALPNLGVRFQEKVFHGQYSKRGYYIMTLGALVLCILSSARITSSSFNPFIYFRF